MTTMTTKGARVLTRGLVLGAALAMAGCAQSGSAQSGSAAPSSQEAQGRRIYEASCAQCHLLNGEGTLGFYPPLDGDPFVTAVAQLPIQVVLEGRAPSPRTPPMPSFADRLSNQEIAAVVSYIRTQWSNDAGPVDAEAVASIRSNLPAEDEPTVDMPAGWRAEGEELFMSYCAACHQDQGEGAEDIFPALAGNPLVDSTDGQYLIHVLMTGRGGMPAFARQLDDEQLAFVLSYIRSAWGNDASPVSPRMVREMGQGGQ